MPRKKRSETKEARRFGVILTFLLLALAGFSFWRDHTVRAALVASGAGAVLVCTFAFFPLWLEAFRWWMKFAEVLSWVMTRVLLSIFFFLVLTPIGLVMRLFGRAPLDLAWKDGKPTYWIDKPETEYTVERYEKQF
jgi:hypothetical protein